MAPKKKNSKKLSKQSTQKETKQLAAISKISEAITSDLYLEDILKNVEKYIRNREFAAVP